MHPHERQAGETGATEALNSIRRVGTRRVKIAVAVVVAAMMGSGCALPTDTLPPSQVSEALLGLVVLDTSGKDSKLHAWLGTEGAPALAEMPVARGAEWIAGSVAGRLAVLGNLGTIQVSDPVTSHGPTDLRWRDVGISYPLFDPQTDFLAWSPRSGHLAMVVDNGEDVYALLIVDPETGSTEAIPVAGAHGVFGPVWLREDVVAVTLPEVETYLPSDGASFGIQFAFRTTIVDIANHQASLGPVGSALAASSDGRFVLTTDSWGQPGALTIRMTDAWLRGEDVPVATLSSPQDAKTGMIAVFDPAGSRVAVAWWTGATSPDEATLSLAVYEESTGWIMAASLPPTKTWPVQLAWLP